MKRRAIKVTETDSDTTPTSVTSLQTAPPPTLSAVADHTPAEYRGYTRPEDGGEEPLLSPLSD